MTSLESIMRLARKGAAAAAPGRVLPVVAAGNGRIGAEAHPAQAEGVQCTVYWLVSR